MTDYHPSYAARIRDLGYLGATKTEIAQLFGMSVATLEAWYERYPEFAAAWDDGNLHASAKVAGALFKRACGYTTTKWKETKDGTFREQVHVEANVPACIFWLTNKRPDQWKQKVEHDLPSGGTLTDALTEIEAARHIAFALAKAIHAAEDQRSIEHDQASQSETE